MSTLDISSDVDLEAIAQRIKARDQEAMGQLVISLQTIVTAIIMKVVHNQHDSEDVFSEVMVQVWDLIDNFNPSKGKFMGWIVTLARRRAIDRLRAKQTFHRYHDELAREQSFLEGSLSDFSEMIDLDEDVRERVRQLINSEGIPVAQREALYLAFFGGLSHREIALRTGKPLGTIKTRLELGMAKVESLIRNDSICKDWILADSM